MTWLLAKLMGYLLPGVAMLLDRAAHEVQIAFRNQVSLMRLLCCVKDSDPDVLPIQSDLRPEPFPVWGRSYQAGLARLCRALPVVRIGDLRYVTEIRELVVGFDSVNVVDDTGRPCASHVEPRQAMCSVSEIIYEKFDVPELTSPAHNTPCARVASWHETAKQSSHCADSPL